MQTTTCIKLAAVLISVFVASANAQIPTDPAQSSLSPEATAAHTQVVKDLARVVNKDVAALKAAVATLEVSRAAGASAPGDVAAVEAAREQLRADQQALAAAAKAYYRVAGVVWVVEKPAKTDVTAGLATTDLTVD